MESGPRTSLAPLFRSSNVDASFPLTYVEAAQRGLQVDQVQSTTSSKRLN
jgi:hypothetical protein